jgi:hypothetical protein
MKQIFFNFSEGGGWCEIFENLKGTLNKKRLEITDLCHAGKYGQLHFESILAPNVILIDRSIIYFSPDLTSLSFA